MNDEIVIASVHGAMWTVEKCPGEYRLLSICGIGDTHEAAISRTLPVVEHMRLGFDDVTPDMQLFSEAYRTLRLATEEDCRRGLEFLGKGGKRLVHCAAGISRSPAIVLGHLLSVCPSWEKAVERLFEIRENADPNAHVLRLCCRILGMEEAVCQIMARARDMRSRTLRAGLYGRSKPSPQS